MKLGLRLYVTGQSSFGRAAQEDILKLQEKYPNVEFDLDVIDVVESPSLAEADEITVTPTILKFSPLPVMKIVCDFSDLANQLGLDSSQQNTTLKPEGVSQCVPHGDNRASLGSIGTKK